MLANSTPEANYSSIVDLYKEANTKIPEDLNAEWLEFSKGYKNRVAGLQVTSGSDKLIFEQYRLLSLLAVKSSTFYAHGFLILAWNLMSRAGSTGNIKFEHVRWDGDHMIIAIPKHKGDRSGGKLPTEKSVYANPVYPEISPFLTSGILLLSREKDGRIESILLGKKSEENINCWLKKPLQPDCTELINRKHITSHCTRKGMYRTRLSRLYQIFTFDVNSLPNAIRLNVLCGGFAWFKSCNSSLVSSRVATWVFFTVLHIIRGGRRPDGNGIKSKLKITCFQLF